MSEALADRYPRQVAQADGSCEIRPLESTDTEALQAFTNSLPEHDLLFLRRDIREPKVIQAWVREAAAGHLNSLMATHEGEVIGCCAVAVDERSFSPHVGELRVLLAPGQRAQGLGRVLVQECFLLALSLGLEKLTARMTSDQQAAVTVFEDMGFHPEALLRNQVQAADGTYADLIVLSHDVAAVQAKLELYGLAEAFD
ncbi:MAG: GNAT family N-acetyltransferase [Pseudomonadales bacterium]